MNHGNERVALVTGATGFIGSHLASRLVRDGWEVHLVVRPESDMAVLAELRGSVTVHAHDGTTNGLQAIVSTAAPRTVFHLASLFLSDHRSADIERLVSSNLLFATQLAEAMVQAGVRQLINTGTSWQHFEGRDYCPVNLYAATKQAFEAILAYYVETTPLRVITLKLYDTYGPGDRRQKLFHLLRQVAERQEPLAMSPGEQLIDLVHIDDVLEAYISAADLLLQERIAGHESFAVSSGAPIKLKDLVAAYARLLGRDLPIQWGGRPYRSREVMIPWHSGTALPGWQPRVSLEEGLSQLIAAAEGQPAGGRR
jgi:nucleoside-diphosphate-sugar epimerase